MRQPIPRFVAEQADLGLGTPYSWVFTFSATIAAAGSDSRANTQDSGFWFLWEATSAHVYTPTNITNGPLAYTDYARAANAPVNSDTYTATTGLFAEVQFQLGNVMLQNVPVPLYLIAGSGERPFWLPTPTWIPPQQTLEATLFNRSAIHTVRGNIVLHGTRYPRRQR